MSARGSLPSLLRSAAADAHHARRQAVGLGVAGGFFAALAGYSLTGHGGWWLAPWLGFAVAWRVVLGHWPLFGPPRR